jgi:MFS family permease
MDSVADSVIGWGSSLARARFLVPALAIFTVLFSNTMMSPLYIVYQQRYHLSSVVVTLLFSTYAVAVLLTLLTVGRASDEIGRRPVLRVGLVLLLVAAGLFIAADGVAWLFVARAVQGISVGIVAVAGSAAVVELSDPRERPRASLVTTMVFVLGGGFGPLVGGILAEYSPNPTVAPFVVVILLGLVSLGFTFAVPETVLERRPARLRPRPPHVAASLRSVFAVAAVVTALAWAVGALFAALSGSVVHNLLHSDNLAVAGIAFFMFNIFGGVSQVALRNRTTWSAMRIGTVLLLCGLVTVSVSAAAGSLALFAAGTVLAGLGQGSAFMGGFALVNDTAPDEHRAETLSALNAVAYLSMAVPVVGVAIVSQSYGLQTAVDLFTVVVVAVGVAFAWVLPRSARRHPEVDRVLVFAGERGPEPAANS